jgi:hypothetical protein
VQHSATGRTTRVAVFSSRVADREDERQVWVRLWRSQWLGPAVAEDAVGRCRVLQVEAQQPGLRRTKELQWDADAVLRVLRKAQPGPRFSQVQVGKPGGMLPVVLPVLPHQRRPKSRWPRGQQRVRPPGMKNLWQPGHPQ